MSVKLHHSAYEHAKKLIMNRHYVLDQRADWTDHKPARHAEKQFITRHGLALSGCAIADYKGWTVTICGSQPRNHTHSNRR